jgi:cyanate permease
MMLGFGYSGSGLAPFGLGAIRDATGSFRTSLWLLVGITTLLVLVVAQLGPARIRRGVSLDDGLQAGPA